MEYENGQMEIKDFQQMSEKVIQRHLDSNDQLIGILYVRSKYDFIGELLSDFLGVIWVMIPILFLFGVNPWDRKKYFIGITNNNIYMYEHDVKVKNKVVFTWDEINNIDLLKESRTEYVLKIQTESKNFKLTGDLQMSQELDDKIVEFIESKMI